MKKAVSFFNPVFLMLITGAFLFVSSCSKDEKEDPGAAATTAKVSGVVTTPSGKRVPTATVITGTYSTQTDINGEFELKLPSGDHQLIIQTGEGRIFKTVVTLSLTGGVDLVLPPSETVLLQILDLAYIEGAYDQIQTLITDSLGYAATSIPFSNLNVLSTFSQYGGLFLNCGLLNSDDMSAAKYTNLMDYAMNHGSIYTSDFAVECLTGDGNLRIASPANVLSHSHEAPGDKTAITCINPLIGGFIPDSALCTQRMGSMGTFTNAVILDPDMIVAAGTNSMNIIYNLPNWEIVHSYDAPFTPIITHPTLGVLALKADLNPTSSTGAIYFTTFHNHPQGVSNEVEAILNYIILNL